MFRTSLRGGAILKVFNSCTKNYVDTFKHCDIIKISHNVAAPFTSDVQNSSKNSTIGSIEDYWKQRFEAEGITEPIESIQYLICHVLGTTKILLCCNYSARFTQITDLINLTEKTLNKAQLEKLESLCECRLSRMPVQYIIGEWDFRDIKLRLEPPIFIPRPETETIVDLVLKKAGAKRGLRNVLEIGCGSGAICLSLLHSNQHINVFAIDINPQACDLTIRNARDLELQNRLNVFHAELSKEGTIEVNKKCLENLAIDLNKDKFDFIVSNPPYIPTKRIFTLQPEINLYEDIQALDGGGDGLQLIQPMLKYASEALSTCGTMILEVDDKHPERIEYLVEKCYSGKLKFQKSHKDFCNKDRFVEIVKVDQ